MDGRAQLGRPGRMLLVMRVVRRRRAAGGRMTWRDHSGTSDLQDSLRRAVVPT
jgi:hypothetical protein